MRIATTFAEVDRICDYIPIVSTASNIVDLFQKCVYKCLPENIAKNRYWTHIKWKEISRCIILLIPILGNLYIIIDDYFEYKKNKTSCDEAIQSHQRSQCSQADILARHASLASGLQVTGDQMMAAPTEDEQRLWCACLGNDPQPIRELLQREISPNFYHAGATPLVTACQHSTAEVVRLLVEGCAQVNTSDRMGNSPFAAACKKGNIEMVKLLHPHIQDINTPNAKGITPLMWAAASGNQDVVQFLIAQGADRNAACTDSSDALTFALFLKDHAHLLPLLLPEEADIDARRYQFQIPRLNLFSFLAPQTIQNLSPLLYATLVGAENSAISLVERSNVQHLDSTNSNALHYASNHMPLLQALLNKCHVPEFVNQQNIAGSTALHHAIELNRPDAALFLLQNGANPFIPDNKGKIPLLVACEKDFVNVVEYIQQHHADHITAEIGEQVATATQAAIARKGQVAQAQPESRDGGLSAAFRLMQTGLNSMQSILEDRANGAREMEDLGPFPRTGMELFLGKLPRPAYYS